MDKALQEVALSHTTKWGVELGETVPFPGPADSQEWLGTAPGTTRIPGRNRPPVGAWIFDHYFEGRDGIVCSDPMVGAGCLWNWIAPARIKKLWGVDCEAATITVAQANLADFRTEIARGDARSWKPWKIRMKKGENGEDTPVIHRPQMHLVMTSHPFPQSHSSGGTKHQQEIRERKNLHAMQEFGTSPSNIANMKTEADRWCAILQTYARIRESLRPDGISAVILRNHVKGQVEQPEVEKHIWAMRMAGLTPFRAHPRDLVRPAFYEQAKLSKNPDYVWTRLEWVITARR